MDEAKTSTTMSPQLARVAARARKHPRAAMLSLAHHIDIGALRRAYERLRNDAAVGVDGVSKQEYGQNLEANLQDLHRRLREQRYRHQPIRRITIPKERGKQRPIGISTIEDKLVQATLHELLAAIYEQDFLACSYGFRPNRRAHDAVRALHRAIRQGKARWILEFDIQSFFDSLDRPMLEKMLQKRIADKSLLRLIGKCLHVGVLDGEVLTRPDEGTVQGSVMSPILANIYLHHALDLWFVEDVRPCMRGYAMFVRYADDGLFGFERQDDAERVQRVLDKRMARFGLTLHPDKTRLVDFRRPPLQRSKATVKESFDLLGFTFYWRRSRKGQWFPACKTRCARLRRAINAVTDWCRCHRHLPVADQHKALVRRLRGHFNYFGVKGNERSLGLLVLKAKRAWYKWLKRRSQRSRMNWQRFNCLLRDYPLPVPRSRELLSLWD